MITTSAPPARSRIFEIALVLSLLVHLLVVLVYFGVFARLAPLVRPVPLDEPVAVSDVVRLEKRTVPRPSVRVLKPQPPPRPQVARAAPPQPVPVRRPVAAPKPVERPEIAHVFKSAPAQPRPAPTSVRADAQRQVALNQSAPQSTAQDTEAAQEQRYLNAIAQSKTDLANISPPKQIPSAIRRLNADMLGTTIHDVEHAQGYVVEREPCDRYSAHCYFVRVHLVYSDGYVEDVSVPWAFIFTSRFDPLQYPTGRWFTPPDPPSNFRLQHPFYPSRFVCAYYHSDCQALFDAERAAGGGPAAAN